MLVDQRLRLSLKWKHFKQLLKGRTASQLVSGARNRARRTLLEASLRRAYERRALQHSPHLPIVSADTQAILDDLETEGVHIGSMASLNVPSTSKVLQSASALLPTLARSSATDQDDFMVQTRPAYFKDHPELYLWGVDDHVLDLVENYLGVPVGFDGVHVNRSIANGLQRSTRMWHLDQQDHRMFRIIIYLNDIDDDNAAFQYIPRQQSERARRSLGYSNELVSDAIMRDVVPADQWKSCVGPRGTAIFVDPANIFHRGKVPKSEERYAIFYSYHSAKPMHERYLWPGYSPDFSASINDNLSERQRACVFWRK
jgi:hypothetical protein